MTSKARGLADLGNAYSDGALSNRNMIINGGMQVAQRGTASVTLTNIAKTFLADRFGVYQNSSTAVTMSQETDAPVGFSNSLKVAMGTGSTPSGANELNLAHNIEGYNTSSLALGTANAKEFTVSFWVKSSLTGNFGMALMSASAADSFVTSYTIGSAGTWEYKTVTLTGKTSGTWNSTNGAGLRVVWDLGSSTNFEATKDTWGTGNKFTFSGATKVVATSSATWQIAGVQLELGDTATPFEHRSYGDELARCQRYFYNLKYTAYYQTIKSPCRLHSTTIMQGEFMHPVTMRTGPTLGNNGVGNFRVNNNVGGDEVCSNIGLQTSTPTGATMNFSKTTANLSIGNCGYINTEANNDAELTFDAEL